MDRHARDSVVTGYEDLVVDLDLPDLNDRHVLAAAITGRCDTIVTSNLRHFPVEMLEPYGIQVQHPDVFLLGHLVMGPGVFCRSLSAIRKRLNNPPYTAIDYLGTLRKVGLTETVSELERYVEQI